MARRRRIGALLALGTTAMLIMASLASPASAIVTEGCSGSAKFSNGTTVNASQSLSIVSLIPPEDTVDPYAGAIDIPRPPPDEPIPFNGGIQAALAGVFDFTVVSWGGETVEIDATGTYKYEAPSFVPRGTGEILLTANHTQGGKTCVAQVKVTLDGDPGTAAIIGATATALAGAGVVGAGFKKKGSA